MEIFVPIHRRSSCPQRDLSVNLTLVVSCRITTGCVLTRDSFTGFKISRCSDASLRATKHLHLMLFPHACPVTSTWSHAVSQQSLAVSPDPVQLCCNLIWCLGEYMFLKSFLILRSHVHSHHHPTPPPHPKGPAWFFYFHHKQDVNLGLTGCFGIWNAHHSRFWNSSERHYSICHILPLKASSFEDSKAPMSRIGLFISPLIIATHVLDSFLIYMNLYSYIRRILLPLPSSNGF